MKTSELIGPALDWAVAKCQPDDTLAIYFDEDTGEPLCHDDWESSQEFKPSTDWSQGGPIIERERIDVLGMVRGEAGPWTACLRKKDEAPPWRHITEGPTPLIAAMRCYVQSRLGDEVEIPEELQ